MRIETKIDLANWWVHLQKKDDGSWSPISVGPMKEALTALIPFLELAGCETRVEPVTGSFVWEDSAE